MHSGITLPGGHEVAGDYGAMVNPECGAWLHVVNMFLSREHAGVDHVEDTRWQWLIDRLAKPGRAA